MGSFFYFGNFIPFAIPLLLMNDLYNNLPILDVPYFQQTRISTCGPAALMMVMKYWDNSFEFSRRIELLSNRQG